MVWCGGSVATALVVDPLLVPSTPGPVLEGFGVKPDLANPAWLYAVVLLVAMPGRILNGQVNQFFSSQRIMLPVVVAPLCGMLLNVILGLIFVLGIPVDPNTAGDKKGFGFPACPSVTAFVEYVQLGVLVGVFIVWKKWHTPCWPKAGWSRSHFTRDRIMKYMRLYVPAAAAISSDFWRVAAIGAVAATLGGCCCASRRSSKVARARRLTGCVSRVQAPTIWACSTRRTAFFGFV